MSHFVKGNIRFLSRLLCLEIPKHLPTYFQPSDWTARMSV